MPDSINQPAQIIDLNFQNLKGAIAAFLIPLGNRAALIEAGPASTFSNLTAGINAAGYELADISDVLVTHIHLDHAGAAGLIARHGARVHVHPRGAPHLANPQRLLKSASRIYGDEMDRLWGTTVSVPEDQIQVINDKDRISLGHSQVIVLETPGHASHHHSYLFEDICFSGDIGGVRLSNTNYVELPLPPPDIDLSAWQGSIAKISKYPVSGVAPTHFGLFTDADHHFERVSRTLDEVISWIERTMRDHPDEATLRGRVTAWADAERQGKGLSGRNLERIEAANPAWMAAAGILRYWQVHGKEKSA